MRTKYSIEKMRHKYNKINQWTCYWWREKELKILILNSYVKDNNSTVDRKKPGYTADRNRDTFIIG